MIRLLFLLPVVLCLGWYLYLKSNNWTMQQGKQGFLYILSFSAFVAGFFALMLWVTG